MFRANVVHLLYGGKYEVSSAGPLIFLLLALLATCFTSVLGVGLMALERPDRNFWAYVGSTAVTLGVGLPLAARKSVQGAAEGMFLSTLVAAGLMYFFYRRVASRELDSPASLCAGARPEEGEQTVVSVSV